MINKQIVKDIDADVLKLALAIFVKNASKEFPLLIKYLNHKNYPEAKKIAHKLAGSSISVGLEELSLLLKKIENDMPETPVSQEELELIYQKTIRYIQSIG